MEEKLMVLTSEIASVPDDCFILIVKMLFVIGALLVAKGMLSIVWEKQYKEGVVAILFGILLIAPFALEHVENNYANTEVIVQDVEKT